MAVARPIISLLALLFLAGGIAMQLFVILSGGVNGNPENKFYFLEASDIGNIPNARNPSRWTFFAICGVDRATGYNANCGSPVPALPFDPPRNFGTRQNVPHQFIGTHRYYYLSRFMFAFYIISLFSAALALFTGFLAICTRIAGYLSALLTLSALFFQTLAAALMTAWTVQGRNHFRSNNQRAKLGVKSYALTWTAVTLFFLSALMFCLAPGFGRDRGVAVSRKRSTRSTRSRGSFLDTESGRRIKKDDY